MNVTYMNLNLLSYSTSLRFLATVFVRLTSVSPVRSTRGGRRVVAVTYNKDTVIRDAEQTQGIYLASGAGLLEHLCDLTHDPALLLTAGLKEEVNILPNI